MSAATAERAGMITGVFNDRESAERAYQCTSELGYSASEIDVLMSEETRARLFPEHEASTELAANVNSPTAAQSKTAAELGGPTGGTIGTAAPIAAAIGTLLLIPGIGIAVAGPVAIALTAAAAVGITGGVIGALTHWGMSRSQVEEYEGALRNGGIVLGLKPHSPEDARHIIRCWRECCGATVHS